MHGELLLIQDEVFLIIFFNIGVLIFNILWTFFNIDKPYLNTQQAFKVGEENNQQLICFEKKGKSKNTCKISCIAMTSWYTDLMKIVVFAV